MVKLGAHSLICFFQAEDGIRDLVRSRGLGDVYKRQDHERETDLCGHETISLIGAVPGFRDFADRTSVHLSLIHI